MIVRKTVGTVGTLTHEAVATAVSVARHPIGSTALVAGFVRGAAGAGIGLLRTTITGTSPTPDSEKPPAEAPAESLAPEAEAPTERAPADEEPAEEERAEKEPETPTQAHEREIPGPDLAHFEPPRPEDLPEPIVIVADDAPAGNGEFGEPFHHEPKVASREVAHGEPGPDFEQADGFADEIPEGLEVDRRS
jgi:hypothetical protein